MNYTLPYYGKKGTIKNIEEKEKNYQVTRYGMNKSNTYQLQVKKNKQNEELLIENYYNDLLEYLNVNKNKYNNYKQNNNKIKSSTINLLKITGIVMIATSIPLIQSYETAGYIGIALDILSIPVIAGIIKLSIEEKKQNKRTDFINKYDELKHKLKIYTEKETKSLDLTKYSTVMKDDKEPKRDINKKLERKKVA